MQNHSFWLFWLNFSLWIWNNFIIEWSWKNANFVVEQFYEIKWNKIKLKIKNLWNYAKSFVCIKLLFPVPNVFSIISSLLFIFKFLYASCTLFLKLSISVADAFRPPPVKITNYFLRSFKILEDILRNILYNVILILRYLLNQNDS